MHFYFGPQTSTTNKNLLQKNTNTVSEIINLVQSWGVQRDFDLNTCKQTTVPIIY